MGSRFPRPKQGSPIDRDPLRTLDQAVNSRSSAPASCRRRATRPIHTCRLCHALFPSTNSRMPLCLARSGSGLGGVGFALSVATYRGWVRSEEGKTSKWDIGQCLPVRWNTHLLPAGDYLLQDCSLFALPGVPENAGQSIGSCVINTPIGPLKFKMHPDPKQESRIITSIPGLKDLKIGRDVNRRSHCPVIEQLNSPAIAWVCQQIENRARP